MKRNRLERLTNRITVELLVSIFLCLYVFQVLVFFDSLSKSTFLVVTIISSLGMILGLVSTSLILAVTDMLLVFLGAFLLYFEPILMSTELKLFMIFAIPVYSFLTYLIKRSLFIRKLLAFRNEDIQSYLNDRDPLTGYRTLESFQRKYEQFITSLPSWSDEHSRMVCVSLYYVDFYDQYFYRNEEATNQLIRDMAQTLLYVRYPEELFFYTQNGTFVVLSVAFDNEQERQRLKTVNEVTKTQLGMNIFRSDDKIHHITIRKAELFIDRKTTFTPDQAISYLKRRAEVDLSEEYIY